MWPELSLAYTSTPYAYFEKGENQLAQAKLVKSERGESEEEVIKRCLQSPFIFPPFKALCYIATFQACSREDA